MKNILFALLIVGFNPISRAQINDIRAYAGGLITQISASAEPVTKNGVTYTRTYQGKLGAQSGIGFTMGDKFYIHPGFQFLRMQAGVTRTDSIGTSFYDEVVVNMIAFPLKVGLNIVGDKKTMAKVRIYGGLTGFIVTEVDNKPQSGFNQYLYEKKDFTNLMMAADVGMGVDFLFLFADLGYKLGLSPITATNNSKANIVYLNVGVRINLNEKY